MIGLAMLIGRAKPTPWADWATAVGMPMTFPAESRRAPPELPGLMAASVWIRLRMTVPSWTWIPSFRKAEMIPAVTEFVYVPSGLPIGGSSTVKVGQLAIAFGSPLGTYTNSVTAGIISAFRKDGIQVQDGTVIRNLIQTDAAINPGNSGGALLDSAG